MKLLPTITLVVASLAITQTVEAMPHAIQKMKQKIKQAHTTKKMNKKIVPLCTNFTGNWRGTCKDREDETGYEATVQIVQTSCQTIKFHGQEIPINGSITSQAFQPAGELSIPFTVTAAFEWNDSQTKLRTLFNGWVHKFNWAMISHGKIWIEDDRLFIEDIGSANFSTEGPTEYGVIESQCEYERVAE